jgi:putative oxidoreductase
MSRAAIPIRNRAASLVLRLGLAFVFAYAGVEKWRAAGDFVERIANYQFLPDLAPWVALLLPSVEIAASIAVLVFTVRWQKAGALLMLLLLLVFTVAMARAWSLGINIECGCFGKGSPSIGPLSFLRNTGLISAVLALLWIDRVPSSEKN